jgi:hypothetical protein
MAEKRERENRETYLERLRGSSLAYGESFLFPLGTMAKSDWPASEITQEHLQNLVSQKYMTTVELATCCVPVDPASPAPIEGYVVACLAFYE